MHENDRVRTFTNRRLEYLPRMDERGGERADADGFVAQNLVFRAHEEHEEVLLAFIRDSSSHVLENILRSLHFAVHVSREMQSPLKFEDRRDLHCLGLADSGSFLQLLNRQVGEPFKAVRRDELVAGIEDVQPRRAGAENEREQLRRAEGFLARTEKPLPRTIVRVDVVYAHDVSCRGSGVDEYAKDKSALVINANARGPARANT